MADHRPVSESLLEREHARELILRSNFSREASEFPDAGATFGTVSDTLAADQLVDNVERVIGDEKSGTTWKTNT